MTLGDLLVDAERQSSLLLQEAEKLLRDLDIIADDELAQLLARRQEIVDWFQNFDVRLYDCMDGSPDAHAAVAKFRICQKETMERVLEIDAMTVALAKGRLASIGDALAACAKEAKVLSAYGETVGGTRRHRLDSVL
ncbi:hypothetical protein [Geobacter grbiciae]|uniref:hypothetical protein n=1 Tax=Geobacter grbiciae TaxID=155042 RepID=UPI001C01856F|nr:hypothetical protein [Geobacter grbiciae]MBT1075258.1 hypothetical protein [Geobacter grbiciae]